MRRMIKRLLKNTNIHQKKLKMHWKQLFINVNNGLIMILIITTHYSTKLENMIFITKHILQWRQMKEWNIIPQRTTIKKYPIIMNIDINKLEKEIKDYKANFFSSWNDEKYKWEAVSWFQSHWDIKSPDFTQMLETSLSKTQNLLGAQHYFPRRMIKNFAMVAPEDVRKMFIDLYNEHIPLPIEFINSIKESDFILEKYKSTWRNHFQDYRTISTYLWLRYPERYYIFKTKGILTSISNFKY